MPVKLAHMPQFYTEPPSCTARVNVATEAFTYVEVVTVCVPGVAQPSGTEEKRMVFKHVGTYIWSLNPFYYCNK